MFQPRWNTPSGTIGTYASGATVNFQLSAVSTSSSFNLRYFLQSGILPPGLTLDTYTGIISGNMGVYKTDQLSTFTIRAIDGGGNLRDRTFTSLVKADTPPNFVTPTGTLLTTLDSVWIYQQIPYTTSISDPDIDITLISGSLPPGLQIDSNGLLHGYCGVVPLSSQYTFTLRISNSIGSNTRIYSIVVNPSSVLPGPTQRLPTILNSRPLSTPVQPTNQYYGYYRIADTTQFQGSIATTPGIASIEGGIGATVGFGSGTYTQTGTTLDIAALDGWVMPGTEILAQLTGAPGGIGTYRVNTLQTVSSTNIYSDSSSIGFHTTFTGSIAADVLTVTAVLVGTMSPGLKLHTPRPLFVGDIVTDGIVTAKIAALPTPEAENGSITLDSTVTFTGPLTINSNKLLVHVYDSGVPILKGDTVLGGTLLTDAYVVEQYSGAPGNLGIYVVNQYQNSVYDLLTIDRNILTVTSITSGSITLNRNVQTTTGTGVVPNTQIIDQLTPLLTGETLGGLGRYTVSKTQTLGSTALVLDVDLGTYYYDDYFSFKIIGYDFDSSALSYQFVPPVAPLPNGQLPLPSGPPGLTMNPATGWITGTPTDIGTQRFDFTVQVTNASGAVSNPVTFGFTFSSVYSTKIRWITPAELGTIINYHPSQLSVEAISDSGDTVKYRLISGELPPPLELLPNGLIIGRVGFNSTNYKLLAGSTTAFTFTIEASTLNYPSTTVSTRTFTVSVLTKYTVPIETIYLKCTPPVVDRRMLVGQPDSLFTEDIISTDLLYRPEDPYFGANEQIRIDHIYGVNSNDVAKYIEVVQRRNYKRQFTLGEIKTAVARDDTGKIIYEVVYCRVIDNLVNPAGVSVNYEIKWPTAIPISTAVHYFDSLGDIYTSWIYLNGINYYTSLIWDYVTLVYPNSLKNMETNIVSELGRQADTSLMPAWMTSQQRDGGTLGYVPAWVICYTKPGQSETVRSSILQKWPYTMNLINFDVARVYVDKSMTWGYDPVTKLWDSLPTGVVRPITVLSTVAPDVITATGPTTDWYVDLAFTLSSSTGTAIGGLDVNTVYYVKDVDNSVTPARITISKRLDKLTEILVSAGIAGQVIVATPLVDSPQPIDSKDYMIPYDDTTIIY